MTSDGNNFNDFPETTFTGHRITENYRLTHLGEMPEGDGDLPEWVGFRGPSLHVKRCSVVTTRI